MVFFSPLCIGLEWQMVDHPSIDSNKNSGNLQKPPKPIRNINIKQQQNFSLLSKMPLEQQGENSSSSSGTGTGGERYPALHTINLYEVSNNVLPRPSRFGGRTPIILPPLIPNQKQESK